MGTNDLHSALQLPNEWSVNPRAPSQAETSGASRESEPTSFGNRMRRNGARHMCVVQFGVCPYCPLGMVQYRLSNITSEGDLWE